MNKENVPPFRIMALVLSMLPVRTTALILNSQCSSSSASSWPATMERRKGHKREPYPLFVLLSSTHQHSQREQQRKDLILLKLFTALNSKGTTTSYPSFSLALNSKGTTPSYPGFSLALNHSVCAGRTSQNTKTSELQTHPPTCVAPSSSSMFTASTSMLRSRSAQTS